MEQKKINEKEAEDIITVTAPVKIDKGAHEGIITNVIRNLPNEDEGRLYDYLDIVIKITDHEKEPELKCGFPTNISELSTLGRLLKKSGFEFKEDDQIKIADIKNHLIKKQVTILTSNEKSKDGAEFARIIRDSIDFN